MSEDLVSKFLGGDAGDDEIARLGAAIRSDPAVIDALFAGAELERDLVQAFRGARRRRLLPLSLAAAGLLAASIAGFLFFSGPPEVARVDRLDGEASRGDGTPFRAGDVLRAGEGIRTAQRALLSYADGTRLELGPGTVVSAMETRGGKRIDLARGLLQADVVPQPSGEPMRIRTAEGEAAVLGTRFTLAATPGSTRLEVEEGRIRLTRARDGASVEIPAAHSARIAKDAPFTVRKSIPEAPNSWIALPSSNMSRVAPPGVAAVVEAWSGAAFDTRRERLVLWGGGHSDYQGNELYAFDLRTLSWERLTDPTPSPKLGHDANDDGTPNGRATYNGLAYHARADRFFALGGVLAGTPVEGAREPWTFDFDARRWTRRKASGPRPAAGAGGACAYDPAGGKIWWADPSGIYSYELDADRWTRHSDEPVYYLTGAIDTRRGLWVLVGQGKALAVDLRTGRPQPWKTSGGDALLAKANPGFDYDPVGDRLVAWAGGPVWSLDPETKTWSASDAPGAPAATPNGIFGRWRYVPGVDAFIVVTAVDRPVHLYKPNR